MEHSGRVEVYLDKLAETGRVVVLKSFRVTEGLEEGVGIEDLLLDCRVGVLVLHCLSLGRFFVQEVFFGAVKPFAGAR